jgi:hypothetical protein
MLQAADTKKAATHNRHPTKSPMKGPRQGIKSGAKGSKQEGYYCKEGRKECILVYMYDRKLKAIYPLTKELLWGEIHLRCQEE